MKIAKITPMFKANETTLVENYRPFSVLPYFSKILERIIYNRLFKYLVQKEYLILPAIWLSKSYFYGACHYSTVTSIT